MRGVIGIKKLLIILFSLSLVFITSSCGSTSQNKEIDKLQRELNNLKDAQEMSKLQDEIDKLKEAQEEYSEESETNDEQHTVKIIIEKEDETEDYIETEVETEIEEYSSIKYNESYVGYLTNGKKKLNIHLWFNWYEGASMGGKYYYDKYKKDIHLDGYLDGSNSSYSEIYTLFESVDGKYTGIFTLGLNDNGTLSGTWSSPESTTPEYEVYLIPVY